MRFISTALLILFSFLLQIPFAQTGKATNTLRQHPILKKLDRNASNLIEFHHHTDNDYYIPLAILNKGNQKLYYIDTFGQIFDSIATGPNLFKQLLTKDIDVFEIYFKLITLEQLSEIQQIRTIIRKQGNNLSKQIPQKTYINYAGLKSAASSFEKIIILDNYEKAIWQQCILMNMILKEPEDNDFIKKKSAWNNYTPGKLKIHETQPADYVEYTSSNRFSSLRKAILYPNTATVYLYNQQDLVEDSFTIKKEKQSDMTAEKTDVFALYRLWLEWQLEHANTQLIKVAGGHVKSATSDSAYEVQSRQLISLQKYSRFLQQKILYAVVPDQDLLLINVLEQTKFTPRRIWSNTTGWTIHNPPPTPTQQVVQIIKRGDKEMTGKIKK